MSALPSFFRLSNLLPHPGLQGRFRLALALVLFFFCVAGALLVYRYELKVLEEHTYYQTELVMSATAATRRYVVEQLRPRMQEVLGADQFIIEAMSSSYISRQVMEYFQAEIPDFTYRRVGIKARNPDFEATALEAQMIQYYRDNPRAGDWRGIITANGQRVFMRFSPVFFEPSCLACHGQPHDAPPYILENYGADGGFQRLVGLADGLVSIAVPVEKALAHTRKLAFFIFGGAFLLMFALYLAIVFFFERLIVGSLRDMLERFRENLEDDEGRLLLEQTSKLDEIGELNAAAGLIAGNLRQAREHLRDRAKNLEEKAKLERQLLQAQKMESIGRLAGGVAHDFNNMLQGILGYCELMLLDMEPTDPRRSDLLEIRKAAKRSAALTRQLLAFARQQPAAPKVVDLNGIAGGMLKMLKRLIGEDIELDWQPAAQLWPVKIDPSQVDQLLANLVVNARDAIRDGGRIGIRTENVTLDEAYCACNINATPGDYVLLTVNDSGCGMDRQTINQIFEPFFTTKEPGKGTGLGLSTVYGLVRQNNGYINVYSEPGQGTTFRVYLPRCAAPAGEPETVAEKPAATAGGRETILLVEDEKAILTLAETLLSRLGYTVLAAATPHQALESASQTDRIDLLITDVVMPGMNGRELAEQLTARRPELKVLYMSGYPAEVISSQTMLGKGVHFIQKPFTLDDLAAKIREVLTQGEASSTDKAAGPAEIP